LELSDEQLQVGSPLAHLCNITSNAADIAHIAANYFLERCFTHFAYVGVLDRAWSQRRGHEFTNTLAKQGKVTHVYVPPQRVRDRLWEREQSSMAEWLKELPKPIGVFACDDDRGREVLEACVVAKLRVPEEVAVLGVDNDEVFCDLAYPPLSSISLSTEAAGYQAAELLDAMMQSGSTERRSIVMEALGVETRRSTDIVAVEDSELSDALRFIHSHKGVNITVNDVVGQALVSRRNLEVRFRKAIGRSILDEIQSVRLEQSKKLLVESTLSITQVAFSAGFKTSAYFTQFFHQRVGKTPRQYRKEFSR
jgi:LacI family transcriptional regulator